MINYNVEIDLQSLIFDTVGRVQPVENFVAREAKDFRVSIGQKMIAGPHTGNLYERKRGQGFRRSHRASA